MRDFTGPLEGLRVLELGGFGPVPFACTLLADAGADVVRVDRRDASFDPGMVLTRGRRSIVLDLKAPEDRDVALSLADRADVLVEGFRPGVMERLGLAPDVLMKRQPRLVIGRMTGWGQSGVYSHRAGHDINYIGLSGALAAIGPAGGAPCPPLNLVGDFGGGAMMLVFGILAAVYERDRSGRGQVVDAAMTDGSISLMGIIPWMRARGRWDGPRGCNWMDGGAHYYNTYRCADEKYVAVGAVEPSFYSALIRGLGLEDDHLFDEQNDPTRWPEQKRRVASIIATRTREAWCESFADTDACVSPVLELDEVSTHPHNMSREATVVRSGVEQPAPAPRFSRTPGRASSRVPYPGADMKDVMDEWLLVDGARPIAAQKSGATFGGVLR